MPSTRVVPRRRKDVPGVIGHRPLQEEHVAARPGASRPPRIRAARGARCRTGSWRSVSGRTCPELGRKRLQIGIVEVDRIEPLLVDDGVGERGVGQTIAAGVPEYSARPTVDVVAAATRGGGDSPRWSPTSPPPRVDAPGVEHVYCEVDLGDRIGGSVGGRDVLGRLCHGGRILRAQELWTRRDRVRRQPGLPVATIFRLNRSTSTRSMKLRNWISRSRRRGIEPRPVPVGPDKRVVVDWPAGLHSGPPDRAWRSRLTERILIWPRAGPKLPYVVRELDLLRRGPGAVRAQRGELCSVHLVLRSRRSCCCRSRPRSATSS